MYILTKIWAHLVSRVCERPMRLRTFFVLLPVLLFLTIGAVKIGGWATLQLVPREEISTRTVSTITRFETEGFVAVVRGTFMRAPLEEELKYRVAPLYALLFVWWLLFARFPGVMAFIAVGATTSAYFGYIHGGYGNILMQGVVGLALWWVLVVMSNYGRRPLTGYLCVVLVHALYNISIFSLKLAGTMLA